MNAKSDRELRLGQTVRWASPKNEDERGERFIVRELRGDRVLVSARYWPHGSIVPTWVYATADLVEA